MPTRLLLPLAVVVGLLALPGSASAAQTRIEIDLPSIRGNVDATQIKFNGAGHPGTLKANVLLPDGYDPAKRWPVLYLLHGAGESYRSWVTKTKADAVTANLPAIVVMPDAATGFYTNWWNGGKRGSPGWERYFLDEVIPTVEARFPIRPERRWHAVAGFSMGGFGSAYLASQRPDYFGSSGPMSGFLAPRRTEMPIAFDTATGQSYQAIYGPADGHYVEGHDPVALAGNLRHTRMFVITGDGVPDPSVPPPTSQAILTDSIGEADLRFHSEDFATALQGVGADTTLTVLRGTHAHPYWNDHLRRLLAWDPFVPVPERPDTWTYKTVADRGRAWEVTYRFAAPPDVVQTLARTRQQTFSAAGSGNVELCAADGTGLRAPLPFEDRRLARAVRLSVLGRRGSRVRVRVRADEAVVARVTARVARGRTVRSLQQVSVELAAGRQRVVALPIPSAARRLMRGGAVRVRAVARHGSCEGGRWSTAGRTLRR